MSDAMIGNSRLPGDLLGRWTRLVTRLEETEQGWTGDGPGLHIDWSDLVVLNAYLTEDAEFDKWMDGRDTHAPVTPTLSAPTDDLAKWQGYLDTIAELRAQLRHAQQATLSAQSVETIREAIDYVLQIAAWEADVRLYDNSQFPHSKIVAAIDTVNAWLDAQRRAQSVAGLSVATIVDELERLCLAKIDEIGNENNIHVIVFRAALEWLATQHVTADAQRHAKEVQP